MRNIRFFYSLQHLLPLVLILLGKPNLGIAQQGNGQLLPARVENGDTIPIVYLPPIWVIEKGDWNQVQQKRQYTRLFYHVLKVYPIAKEANKRLAFVENELKKIQDPEIKEHYTKMYEQHLKKEFTPVLKKLTYTQGKILIKLIDRETNETSYQLVKRFRGGFQAFLWQSFASLFGADLKTEYDPERDDAQIEEIIKIIESGKY